MMLVPSQGAPVAAVGSRCCIIITGRIAAERALSIAVGGNADSRVTGLAAPWAAPATPIGQFRISLGAGVALVGGGRGSGGTNR